MLFKVNKRGRGVHEKRSAVRTAKMISHSVIDNCELAFANVDMHVTNRIYTERIRLLVLLQLVKLKLLKSARANEDDPRRASAFPRRESSRVERRVPLRALSLHAS